MLHLISWMSAEMVWNCSSMPLMCAASSARLTGLPFASLIPGLVLEKGDVDEDRDERDQKRADKRTEVRHTGLLYDLGMDAFEKVLAGIGAAWVAAIPVVWWRLRRGSEKIPTGILHTRDFRKE